MYPFSELCERENYPFCYLVGVLKKMPRLQDLHARFFTDEFEWILNVEDQSNTVRQTKKRSDLLRKYLLPTAPPTMTPSWSPFPLAFAVLKRCLYHGKEERSSDTGAFGIWEPHLKVVGEKQLTLDGKVIATFDERVSDDHIEFESLHARHFFWLLEMTIQRAQQMKRPVIVAGTPGYSYENAVKYGIPSHTRLRLLQSGYLYPERVPHLMKGLASEGFDEE